MNTVWAGKETSIWGLMAKSRSELAPLSGCVSETAGQYVVCAAHFGLWQTIMKLTEANFANRTRLVKSRGWVRPQVETGLAREALQGVFPLVINKVKIIYIILIGHEKCLCFHNKSSTFEMAEPRRLTCNSLTSLMIRFPTGNHHNSIALVLVRGF